MDPYSQRDHDEAVEEFGRALLLAEGVVVGVVLILVFG